VWLVGCAFPLFSSPPACHSGGPIVSGTLEADAVAAAEIVTDVPLLTTSMKAPADLDFQPLFKAA